MSCSGLCSSRRSPAWATSCRPRRPIAITRVNTTFHTTFNVGQFQQQLGSDNIGKLLSQYGSGLLGLFGSAVALLFDGLTVLFFAHCGRVSAVLLGRVNVQVKSTVG